MKIPQEFCNRKGMGAMYESVPAIPFFVSVFGKFDILSDETNFRQIDYLSQCFLFRGIDFSLPPNDLMP